VDTKPLASNEVNALLWVYATLVESAAVYDSVLPPLTSNDRETYYAESKAMAALFGIPATALPADWSGFEAYNRAMWTSDMLGVNVLLCEMAHPCPARPGILVPVQAPGYEVAQIPSVLTQSSSRSYLFASEESAKLSDLKLL
jgi:ER-bound oxygenase mpaB/B'/Rubber oxygenase, catalytic domain